MITTRSESNPNKPLVSQPIYLFGSQKKLLRDQLQKYLSYTEFNVNSVSIHLTSSQQDLDFTLNYTTKYKNSTSDILPLVLLCPDSDRELAALTKGIKYWEFPKETYFFVATKPSIRLNSEFPIINSVIFDESNETNAHKFFLDLIQSYSNQKQVKKSAKVIPPVTIFKKREDDTWLWSQPSPDESKNLLRRKSP